MKNTLLKSLITCSLLGASAIANAQSGGDGKTAATAYTVCPSATSFKLTTNEYPTSYTYTWTAVATPTGTTETPDVSTTGVAAGNEKSTYTVAKASGFATGSYSYRLDVTSDLGCVSSQEFFVKVIDTTLTVVATVGSGSLAAICEDAMAAGGETVTLTATAVSGTVVSGYAWTASGTATVDAPTTTTGSNTGNVPVEDGTYVFGATATYTVDVAPAGGCTKAASDNIIVQPKPEAPSATISGL